MTREEALNKAIAILTYNQVNFCKSKEAVANMNEIIDALEKIDQEPCDDAISRSATLDAIIKRLGIKNETYLLEAERVIYQQILAMPSVTPQPCDDCVSRQAVLDTIGNVPDYDDGMVWEALSHAQRDVALLPPVTPQPKMGQWISNAEDDLKISEYTCSNCKGLSDEDSDFCPKCGAKMSEIPTGAEGSDKCE